MISKLLELLGGAFVVMGGALIAYGLYKHFTRSSSVVAVKKSKVRKIYKFR